MGGVWDPHPGTAAAQRCAAGRRVRRLLFRCIQRADWPRGSPRNPHCAVCNLRSLPAKRSDQHLELDMARVEVVEATSLRCGASRTTRPERTARRRRASAPSRPCQPSIPSALPPRPRWPGPAGPRGHGLVVLPRVHRGGSLRARAAGPPRPPWSLSGAPWSLGCGLEALRTRCVHCPALPAARVALEARGGRARRLCVHRSCPQRIYILHVL